VTNGSISVEHDSKALLTILCGVLKISIISLKQFIYHRQSLSNITCNVNTSFYWVFEQWFIANSSSWSLTLDSNQPLTVLHIKKLFIISGYYNTLSLFVNISFYQIFKKWFVTNKYVLVHSCQNHILTRKITRFYVSRYGKHVKLNVNSFYHKFEKKWFYTELT
jgi:hypothetical protein